MRSGHVIVFHGAGIPLEYREEPSPDPGPNEILVRVAIAGVCGTDAHRLSGDVPALPGPVCFGHEAVGVVEALGNSVTADRSGAALAPGDRVYWSPSDPCGKCWTCRVARHRALCEDLHWPAPAGRPNAAGFRELATVGPRSALYRIPEGTSFDSVIAFGCAMPTALEIGRASCRERV